MASYGIHIFFIFFIFFIRVIRLISFSLPLHLFFTSSSGEKNYEELKDRREDALSLREFVLLKHYEGKKALDIKLRVVQKEKEEFQSTCMDQQHKIDRHSTTIERLKAAHQGTLEDYEKLRADTNSRIAKQNEEIRQLNLRRDTIEQKAKDIGSLEHNTNQLADALKETKQRLAREEEIVMNLRAENLKLTERADHAEGKGQILQQQELSQSRQIHMLEAQVDKLTRDLESSETKLAASKEKKRELVRKVEMQDNRQTMDVGRGFVSGKRWM